MRPLGSYERHGKDSYNEGLALNDCPYPVHLLNGVQWRVGWLRAAIADPLADDPDLEEATEAHADRLEALRSRQRSILADASRALPSAKAAARAIGIPISSWPGNCHGIANALLQSGALAGLSADHGYARSAYGVYLGPIAPGTLFAGRAFVHHGWIEFENGLVVDPTRWVFENTAPAIAATGIGEYDLAGRLTRQMISPRPLPLLDQKARIFRWDVEDQGATAAVAALLGAEDGWDGRIGLAQMAWVGNLPLDRLGVHAPTIYDYFERQGVIALVPLDNRLWIENQPSAPAL